MQKRDIQWTVGEWMTPNPHTVTPDTPTRAAFFRMRSEGVRHLPVVDDGRLVGIVTDRDLRRPDVSDEPDGWHEFYRLDEDYEVRHVMTREVETARSGDRLERAVGAMAHGRFGALPVVDENARLIGILTSFDLLEALGCALSNGDG